MSKPNASPPIKFNVARERLIQRLNTYLANEYQAIVAFIVYSQILKRAAYADIARELELHAAEDFQHAKTIANQIDYLGGTPSVRFSSVDSPNEPISALLSGIVRNHKCQIDMCSLPGIETSPSDHPVPGELHKPEHGRNTLAGTDSGRSNKRHAKRISTKPVARNERSCRKLSPV